MRSVILVGGGWSIKEGIEKGLWNNIKGKEIWSLNFAFFTMPYLPKRELWVDFSFFKNYTKELHNLLEKDVELHCKADRRYNIYPGIKQYNTTRERVNNDKIFVGGNGLVGFFALSLAVRENYDRIYLLGYDWGVNPNSPLNTHYYQDKLNIISNGVGNPSVYLQSDKKPNAHIKDFDYYNKYKDRIFNVSIYSNIYQFNKITYDSFFKLIRKEGEK